MENTTINCLPLLIGYLNLDTWSGFEAAKTAPLPSWGLHHLGKFLEPSDKWAGRGCYCFLMRWHSLAFLADQEWAPETWRAQIWICTIRFHSETFIYLSTIFSMHHHNCICKWRHPRYVIRWGKYLYIFGILNNH